MSDYEILVTAVSERADLFVQTMESLLANVDSPPSRIIVHEDVREGSKAGAIGEWLSLAQSEGSFASFAHKVNPRAGGLGPAMQWCFEQARCRIVLYTQEDWLFVRQLPLQRCLSIMQASNLDHVRFNKRKTMRAKHADTDHPWYKIEVEFPVSGTDETQKFCIADHWYTQASLWRVDRALPGLQACARGWPQANAFVAKFNDWMNNQYGDGPQGAPGVRLWSDQQHRHERLKTYIWGPVAEPAFIKHLGSIRTTGPIQHLPGA